MCGVCQESYNLRIDFPHLGHDLACATLFSFDYLKLFFWGKARHLSDQQEIWSTIKCQLNYNPWNVNNSGIPFQSLHSDGLKLTPAYRNQIINDLHSQELAKLIPNLFGPTNSGLNHHWITIFEVTLSNLNEQNLWVNNSTLDASNYDDDKPPNIHQKMDKSRMSRNTNTIHLQNTKLNQ